MAYLCSIESRVEVRPTLSRLIVLICIQINIPCNKVLILLKSLTFHILNFRLNIVIEDKNRSTPHPTRRPHHHSRLDCSHHPH
ncbi:hypothetical protein Syun_017574 [Stephania yunnanensis]|uniref:Uncharacterized protein n=1 Tax=Stephania yunnanensis TaxID=152371 RepID=A0AAP0J9I9_9MAGN